MQEVQQQQAEPEMTKDKASRYLDSQITGDDDDDEECNKLECMRAGWCMCD